MRSFSKLIASLILIFVLLFNTVSCDILPGFGTSGQGQTNETTFYIEGPSNIEIKVGDRIQLKVVSGIQGAVIWTSSSSSASVEDGIVTALAEGTAVIKAAIDDKADWVTITVIKEVTPPDDQEPEKDPPIVDPPVDNNPPVVDPPVEDDPEGPTDSETVTIPGTEDPVTSDPYTNISKEEFYANYTPATSYMDAYYRTQHNLMSGSIGDQDQKPTISSYRKTIDGKFVRNNVYIFSEDGNTYYVVDSYGEICYEIYRGAAYIMLDEVAAYVFAFGDIPANHSSSKKTNPTESQWEEYLRVNHTKFSGDTSRYPYEPVLPRISGCGGDLTYYEMDIGTTGTDCDPSYTATIYNNGAKIVRGAARIVYSYKDRNGDKIIDLDERYVFYTYNHYNDFQEYLNYSGGWGEMFGNVTGGGTLSSKSNYNPTPYVEVVRTSLTKNISYTTIYYYVPKNEYAA